ncbi:MAG: hypothetical protein KF812_05150 [Fimbriimonadaceae bacterium]|nr:hypothetical protein [Fimbriimonadaceae bacterium]
MSGPLKAIVLLVVFVIATFVIFTLLIAIDGANMDRASASYVQGRWILAAVFGVIVAAGLSRAIKDK